MTGHVMCARCGGRVFKGECNCMGTPRPVYESEPAPVLTPEEIVAYLPFADDDESVSLSLTAPQLRRLCHSHEALREQLVAQADEHAKVLATELLLRMQVEETLGEQLQEARDTIPEWFIKQGAALLDDKEAENRRLRDALTLYGRHYSDCPRIEDHRASCACGLAEIAAEGIYAGGTMTDLKEADPLQDDASMRPRQCEIDRAVLAFTSHGQQPDPVLTPEQVAEMRRSTDQCFVPKAWRDLMDSHEALREQLQERDEEAAAWELEATKVRTELQEAREDLSAAYLQLAPPGSPIPLPLGMSVTHWARKMRAENRRLRDAIGALPAEKWKALAEKVWDDTTAYTDAEYKALHLIADQAAEIAKEGQDDD